MFAACQGIYTILDAGQVGDILVSPGAQPMEVNTKFSIPICFFTSTTRELHAPQARSISLFL